MVFYGLHCNLSCTVSYKTCPSSGSKIQLTLFIFCKTMRGCILNMYELAFDLSKELNSIQFNSVGITCCFFGVIILTKTFPSVEYNSYYLDETSPSQPNTVPAACPGNFSTFFILPISTVIIFLGQGSTNAIQEITSSTPVLSTSDATVPSKRSM
jgi:hypothetical protein